MATLEIVPELEKHELYPLIDKLPRIDITEGTGFGANYQVNKQQAKSLVEACHVSLFDTGDLEEITESYYPHEDGKYSLHSPTSVNSSIRLMHTDRGSWQLLVSPNSFSPPTLSLPQLFPSIFLLLSRAFVVHHTVCSHETEHFQIILQGIRTTIGLGSYRKFPLKN